MSDARQRGGMLGQPHHGALKIDWFGVARRRDGHFGEQQILGGEPHVQPLHAVETSEEQSRRRQDEHGDRYLAHNEGMPEPVSAGAGSGAAVRCPKRSAGSARAVWIAGSIPNRTAASIAIPAVNASVRPSI